MDINTRALLDVFQLNAEAGFSSVSDQDTLMTGQGTTDYTYMFSFIEIMSGIYLLIQCQHLFNTFNVPFRDNGWSITAFYAIYNLRYLFNIVYLGSGCFNKDVTWEQNF